MAVEALRILLARAHLDAVVKALDQDAAWDKMKDSQQHTAGVTLLSRCALASELLCTCLKVGPFFYALDFSLGCVLPK